MRNIINISLTEELAEVARREVATGKYASMSEFFRHLLRTHNLALELKKDKKEFEGGEGKLLKSLKDLG